MKYWIISDTHFSHENIIKYCNRPFKTKEEMNEKIIKNWNEVVKQDDIVFHLGDFSFKSEYDKIKERLIGKIILVSGNHDKGIIHSIIINYGGKMWQLVHNPEEAELDFNICGHVHNHWKIKKEDGKIIYNCGVDVNNFKPVSLNTVIKTIRKEYGNIL